jgi:type IV secretory pathway VirJ component
MKIKKAFSAILLLFGATLLALYLLQWVKPPIENKIITVQDLGDVAIAKPMWGVRTGALIFADSHQFSSAKLAQQLASLDVSAAVIDANSFLKLFSTQTNKCLDAKRLSDFITSIEKVIPAVKTDQLLIIGIGNGALVPFINAQSEAIENTANISVGFSVNIPNDLNFCSPYGTEFKRQHRQLVTIPEMKARWRSVWNEKPAEETAVFIKEKAPHADTDIAAYNTPLDTLLINEVQAMLGQGSDTPPMPVIEIPAEKGNDTVTLFYSGDGGWRDLDRSVSEEMAKLNYAVLGVDVLRYFWERKTPEQAVSDLTATMRYYRSKWGVKSFVLAGFSFGADILPVIYNKLPETEKDNVSLLVFLALGNHADFEVHVGGWLGQSTHEMQLTPELQKMPNDKVLCIYGREEKVKTGTACTSLENTGAKVIELPGGHHFDQDYPKLARLILDNYHQHGIH